MKMSSEIDVFLAQICSEPDADIFCKYVFLTQMYCETHYPHETVRI
jgi:hypothetical protein